MIYLIISYGVYQLIGMLLLWYWCISGQTGAFLLRDALRIGLSMLFFWPAVVYFKVRETIMIRRSMKEYREQRLQLLIDRYDAQQKAPQ